MRYGPHHITRPAGRILVVLLAVTAVGCNEASKATLNTANTAYHAGRFRQSLEEAGAISRRSTGDELAQARYLAGLSAYRLGRDAEAEAYLAPLTACRDTEIAGSANATLGLIHASRNDDTQAVRYFEPAVDKLRGADAARAHYHMALSLQKLGQWASAKTHLDRALAGSRDAALRKVIMQRAAARAFTIQLGAYGQRKNADAKVREMGQACGRAGIASPQIVLSVDEGKTLYLVQVGRFDTYGAASLALRKLRTRDAWIVTTAR